MNIDSLFQRPNALPTAPKVVQVLIKSFNDGHVTIEDISHKLGADPALSAKLLRLANSSYYHVSRSITTVNEAVTVLGFITVRTLVISGGLVNGFKSVQGLDLNQFWRYNLNTAAAAGWLAGKLNGNRDMAFTVGMTHAIGHLVIHTAMPDEAKRVNDRVSILDDRRIETERNMLGYDFAMVGAELSSRWNFPKVFSNAIASFPNPLEHPSFDSMSAIIHMASWFARMNEYGFTQEEIRSRYPTAIANKLGLEPYSMLTQMPPLTELCQGLEELIT